MILTLLYVTVFRFVCVDQFHGNDLFHQFCIHICRHKLVHCYYLRLSHHSPVTNMYAIYCFFRYVYKEYAIQSETAVERRCCS